MPILSESWTTLMTTFSFTEINMLLEPKMLNPSDYKFVAKETYNYLKHGLLYFLVIAIINCAITISIAQLNCNFLLLFTICVFVSPYFDAAYSAVGFNLRDKQSIRISALLTTIPLSKSCFVVAMTNIAANIICSIIIFSLLLAVTTIISWASVPLPTTTVSPLPSYYDKIAHATFALASGQITSTVSLPQTTFMTQLLMTLRIKTRSDFLLLLNFSSRGSIRNFVFTAFALSFFCLVQQFGLNFEINMAIAFAFPPLFSIFKFNLFRAIYYQDKPTEFKKEKTTALTLAPQV